MTKEPSIFCKYGLRADVSGTVPLGAFKLCLAPKPPQETPCSTSAPTLSSHVYNNLSQVTVVKIKDLRQTVAIEISYKDTNAWMEWIKYSAQILNKSKCYYW
jgi:hypothetical protein